MRDASLHFGCSRRLVRAVGLNRRTLLRTLGASGLGGTLDVTAPRRAAAQDPGGAAITSPSRAEVMQEILAAYPSLERDGATAGGSVVVANLGDFDSFHPFFANAGAFELLLLVYEGLVGVHPVDGTIMPWLADFDVAADTVTYTFHLHPDARFHDGESVTAADVEFSFAAFVDPANLTYSSTFRDLVDTYRAVDERTFELVSNGPVASFLFDAVLPVAVLPKHIWEGVALADWPSDAGSTGDDIARVVGSGPFRFEEWVQGDHVTLARNDDYWNRELSRVPYLDSIVFQVVPDSQARTLALEAGGVDVARLASPADIDRLDETQGIDVVTSDSLGFTCYAYQLDEERTSLFQDKAVRQALFVALDRQSIIDALMAGNVEVARSTQPPISAAYRPEGLDAYAYDPIRARELLDQSGWTDAGGGVREKDGQRLSFSMLVRDDHALRNNLAAYMQDAWADIGVEMKVEPVEPAILSERSDTGEFEMILLGLSWSSDPGQGQFFSTGGNFFGYSNSEHDRLEAEQRSTLDPAQRVDLIAEQAKIVWDDLPIGILYFDVQIVGHNERMQNFFPNTFGGLVWSAPFWYLEP